MRLPHGSCLYLEDDELTPEFSQTLVQAGKDISILSIDCGLLSSRSRGKRPQVSSLFMRSGFLIASDRMTDHVLLVGHRSVARVLLAYFKGLKREDVADLDVPLGMLYMLEPVRTAIQRIWTHVNAGYRSPMVLNSGPIVTTN